ncbi:hypothetical protein [Dyadobacter sp. CY312]|uniref:hypothetical protein n=1 Tax=Dyadobacter sp. CY312 TaxID=2907303 RepID=UPI001F3501EC|nr:hypothetical protein [Dyadobacter sp. CY312]MCE7040629.1 hypothetical protein [Dyadobacter sp. CY312]
MKNNFRFIFPRLVGATLIVGLASLVLVTLFKLLLGVMLIGGVVMLVKRMIGRPGHDLPAGPYARFAEHGYGSYQRHNQWAGPITVDRNQSQAQTIVPIN